jgi:hypothetical protein
VLKHGASWPRFDECEWVQFLVCEAYATCFELFELQVEQQMREQADRDAVVERALERRRRMLEETGLG